VQASVNQEAAVLPVKVQRMFTIPRTFNGKTLLDQTQAYTSTGQRLVEQFTAKAATALSH
jgi:hypothetical protein